MNTQRGDAGVSMMLVMMAVLMGFWMFSGGHEEHGMMSSTHDKTSTEIESMPSSQLVPVDEKHVDDAVVQD